MTQPKLTKQTRDRRVVERYRRAWDRFAPDGECPYCGHGGDRHALSVSQPHFYRPATGAELLPFARVLNLLMLKDKAGADAVLATHPGRSFHLSALDDGTPVVLRRITVSKYAEGRSAWCLACAEHKGTAAAVCYQATRAIGEVVGASTRRTLIWTEDDA